jgi:Acetyltransferases, including N-acetylases of ribosomal proteins
MSAFHAPELIESDELLLPPARRLATLKRSSTKCLAIPTRCAISPIFATRRLTKRSLSSIWLRRIGKAACCRVGCSKTRRPAGSRGVIELQPRPPRAEVGVIISRRGGARRRRAGLDALRKFLEWLIAQPQIYRVFACCAVDGNAYTAMERLGFTLEAKLTNYEHRPNLGLPAGDSYLYAMTRPLAPPHMADTYAWMDQHFSVELD